MPTAKPTSRRTLKPTSASLLPLADVPSGAPSGSPSAAQNVPPPPMFPTFTKPAAQPSTRPSLRPSGCIGRGCAVVAKMKMSMKGVGVPKNNINMRMSSVKASTMGMGLPKPSTMGVGLPKPSINLSMSTMIVSMNDMAVPSKKSMSKQKTGFAPLFLDSPSSSDPSEGPSVEAVLSDLSSLGNKGLEEGNKVPDGESIKSSAPWWIMMLIASLVAVGCCWAVVAAWRRWDEEDDDDTDRDVDDAIQRTSLLRPLGYTTQSFHREQLSQ